MKFDSKVESIEEAQYLDVQTMEELQRIITSYEMMVDKWKGTP